MSPLKKVEEEGVPVAERSPVIVPELVIVPPVIFTNVPELVATEVTVPVLLVNPESLRNILNGIVDICVLLDVVPSTTTKSSVPTKVPDADKEFPSKFKVTVPEVPPPDNPVPAVTPVISPVGKVPKVPSPKIT